ncbi:MAG: hypothetical protein IJ456_11390 [Bacteroides sp.]|nr:hypothetical protein [Bacteroides sp.]
MKTLLRALGTFLLVCTLTSACKEKDMSMKMNTPRNIRGVVSYKRSFGDLNDTHLEAAKKIGIKPIQGREAAKDLGSRLVEIKSGDLYQVDSLTHSIPFLIPKANALLDSLGTNFLDSLESKGLNPNQVIVTSVLRTQDDVKRLRKVNYNASANSVHMFGTTFDISYKRFFKVEDPDGRPMQDVSADTLKLVLAEVLRDLKKKEMCYIKYELKQGCFHITAR